MAQRAHAKLRARERKNRVRCCYAGRASKREKFYKLSVYDDGVVLVVVVGEGLRSVYINIIEM